MKHLKRRGRHAGNSTRLGTNLLKRIDAGVFIDRTNQPYSNVRHTALPEALKKWQARA